MEAHVQRKVVSDPHEDNCRELHELLAWDGVKTSLARVRQLPPRIVAKALNDWSTYARISGLMVPINEIRVGLPVDAFRSTHDRIATVWGIIRSWHHQFQVGDLEWTLKESTGLDCCSRTISRLLILLVRMELVEKLPRVSGPKTEWRVLPNARTAAYLNWDGEVIA